MRVSSPSRRKECLCGCPLTVIRVHLCCMTEHFAPEMCLYVAGKWEATIDANSSGGETGFFFAKST